MIAFPHIPVTAVHAKNRNGPVSAPHVHGFCRNIGIGFHDRDFRTAVQAVHVPGYLCDIDKYGTHGKQYGGKADDACFFQYGFYGWIHGTVPLSIGLRRNFFMDFIIAGGKLR